MSNPSVDSFDDKLNPRLRLNNNIQNKRGKLPIDMADRVFWIGHAMGLQAMEHLRMRRTPKEQMTREFIIKETNKKLIEMEMPAMNANETALFIFIMTKYMDIQKRKSAARLSDFMKQATKRFADK